MPRYAYDRLSALDHSFLALERPNAYMHVASTMIYEAGPLRTEDGGIDADRFRKLVASTLHRIPRYRQKLAWIPVEGHPVWVDDPDFSLDYHVRHTALPRPGSEEQLKRLSSRIMQQHLDRDRPLWEMWVVEGLEGDRFALISKVHHCMIDGVSGVDLMKILMSASPEQPIPPEPEYVPRPAPSQLELLRHELARRMRLPLEAVADVRRFAAEARDVRRELGWRLQAVGEALGQTLRRVSTTPFNHPIGPHRRFDWLAMDLARLKTIRRRLGGSLNDVVLAVVTGALQRFLEHRRVRVGELELRALTPVSTRSEDERGALGNRVSGWIVPLPVGERDRRAQLAALRETTGRLKASRQAVAAEALTRAAEWGSSTLLALGARHATRLLPFNLVVTNVPGPQLPLYTLGARLRDVYPHVPLADNLALSIGLMSYDGKLCWGLNADYDLLPDLHVLVDAVRASYEELCEVAESAPVEEARSA